MNKTDDLEKLWGEDEPEQAPAPKRDWMASVRESRIETVAFYLEKGFIHIEDGVYRITEAGLAHDGNYLRYCLRDKTARSGLPNLDVFAIDGLKVGQEDEFIDTAGSWGVKAFCEVNWSKLAAAIMASLSTEEREALGFWRKPVVSRTDKMVARARRVLLAYIESKPVGSGRW